MPAREAVRRAFGHGSYLLLVAGFFVCGFHVAFITTHLPAYIAVVAGHSHAGMDTAGPAVAAWALALIGLFNIVGSYGSGVLGARHSKRQLLAGIYLARAVVIAFSSPCLRPRRWCSSLRPRWGFSGSRRCR